ncbi:uncharacterized protein K460DRAFT_406947 [Cucurbitaria berberidis CBS 394.84]|uniref:Pre-mRNA polyadenylation factor Fip1 domain-containing protein n=1 Tax=Cucurbitaria berberidis CBS 394.84 TaxID=1168544 RepID=A0A9P4L938_9PLEO|nr:uncharacterized protein K460DRAFT_406947 [Cucurbitaria berberidis CBS 394.84]KAF1846756.1 hypothetical protein K460DRAFT_406947 [Cucurbitaria berberidis CBS 394.84]
MADESDDDLYGDTTAEQKDIGKKEDDGSSGDEPMDEGQDSGDDEDDDSESDLEIIIDKPAVAPKPAVQQQQPQASKAIKIEAPPQSSSAPSQAPRTIATGTVPQLLPGTAYPAQRTSNIDVNGNPVYPPHAKEILSVDMEADMAEEQKIWRRAGEDQSDYFNYGFDEFTWEMYRQRQTSMAQALQQQKNDMVQMQQMIGPMPTMPNMPGPAQGGAPTGAPSGPGGGGGGGGGGGMGMNEQAQMEMMFQQMASQGMDPSQMDFASFMQMAGQGMGGGFGAPSGQQGGGFQQGNHGGGGRGGRGGRGRGW